MIPAIALALLPLLVLLPAPAAAVEGAQADGICGRTLQVRTAVLPAVGAVDCDDVTARQLRDLTALDLSGQGIESLRRGDFDGLHRLETLDLSNNSLASLPAGLFTELYLLRTLRLNDNRLARLPADILEPLFLLEDLTLGNNPLAALPDGVGDDLTRFDGFGADGSRSADVGRHPRISRFIDRHGTKTPEAFIAALPALHRQRFVLMYESGAAAAEHVSGEQPRVISFGGDGALTFAWNTDPNAPERFRGIEFLRRNERDWSAGVIDFGGSAPRIREPESCRTCHGALNKPLWGEWALWAGSEAAQTTDPEAASRAAAYMDAVRDSRHPRLAPLDFSASTFETRNYRFLTSPGTAPSSPAAEEAGSVWSWRHAEVLFRRLKDRYPYFERWSQKVVCADPEFKTVYTPTVYAFQQADHNLFLRTDVDHPLVTDSGQIFGHYGVLKGTSDRVRYAYYFHSAASIADALVFLTMAELWRRQPIVRRAYRSVSNRDTVPDAVGADFQAAMLHYPAGAATAEDELIQKLRLHFGRGTAAAIRARDAQNGRLYAGGPQSANFRRGHAEALRSLVCGAVTKSVPTQLEVSPEAGDVVLEWAAPTHDAASVTGYTVLRGAADATPPAPAADTGPVTRWIDREPGNGDYVYQVRARYEGYYDGVGSAPRAVSVAAHPGAVRGLLAARGANGAVSLSWDAPAGEPAATGYRIYRGLHEAELTALVLDTGGTAASHVDDTAASDASYLYSVAALNGETAGPRAAPVRIAGAGAAQVSAAPEIGGAASFNVLEGETLVATLTATDGDSAASELSWSIPAGTPGGVDRRHFMVTASGRLSFRGAKDFEQPDDSNSDGVYGVTVQVTDGQRNASRHLRIALTGRNEAPTADAGADLGEITEGARVTLSGSGSDPDASDRLTFAWTQSSGPAVTLSGAEAATARFTAPDSLPADAELMFRLRVTDRGGLHDEDGVTVTVKASAPVATITATPGIVAEGSPARFTVRLDRPAPPGGLTVGVSVTDSAGRLAGPPPAAVAFAAGEASARVALATADDAVVSGDGSLAAALVAGDGYTLGGSARATVTVSEDDAASWTLAVEPGAVEEGGRAALTASIGNGVAYAEDLEVSFSVAGLEAGEYALEPAAAVLAAGSSSVTAVLELLADEAAEAPGTAALAASAGGAELASATLAVVDAGAAPQVSGVPQVGAVLTAVVDGLADGEAVGYRWLRGDPDGERVPVAGATSARHALTAADVGERLSVEVARLGRTRASGATAPTWPAPANAPVGADEQELLSAELTVRSWRGRVEFAGYSRRADVAGWPASAGALSRPSLALGGAHEVDLVALRVDDDGGGDAWGLLGTTPALADGSDLTVHWNGHRIGPLSRSRSASLDWLWRGSATHGGAGVRRHFGGAADGVRVALSIRRPLPVATLSELEASVAEGSAAAFEVVLDRPAASATAVAVDVSGTAGALDGAPPASVTVAAGASRATLPVATADDAVVRGGGSVTATLAAGAGYRPGAESTATVTVSENDAATWSVSASPAEIAEGGSATLTVSVANGVTFAADREIALSASGTASASDYALPAALALAAGASSATASLRAVPDGESPEPAETVAVAASHGGASIGAATVTIAAHEREPSSDASLSSLALSGADIGPFDPAVTAYSATVGRDVASTRVEATPADANASVEIADASGSTAGPSRTVALSHGDNAVDATVTAEDAATARTYAVTVTREPPLSWGDRLPARDLALGPGAAPGGLWSDGEVLWVSDWWRPALSAHALADGGRVPERDVGIGSVRMPAGLHGASGTLRVVDHHGGAFGHSIADGARRPSADLSAESLESAGASSPTGIWSDGTTAWVAGLGSARLAAFSASDGSRLASRDLELAGMVDALRPWGLWSDGEVLLAASHGSGAVRAYALSDGSRRPGRDVDTGAAGQPQPTGIWSDGAALWVADASAGTVQAYAVPGLSGAGASGPPPDPFAVRASSRAERVPAGASAGPAAAVADPALRSRIAAALGKGPGEPLGAAELASLRSLDARGAGVASLDGLQAAVNLEALDLGLNPVADLRPLASLPRLRSLNLDGAPADPWPLASLPALERLSLRGAGLADAAPLAGLARLRSLDLAGSAVADVSALGGLARLAALRLDGSPVADLSPLAALPELRRLSLRGVAADPAPLAGLRLESLLLDGGAPHGAPPAP